MKEVLSTKAIAVALGLSTALGLTACSGQDPNKLTTCEENWEISGIGTSTEVSNMASTLAGMESARTELVANIQNTLGSNDTSISANAIPAQYKVAASLLIGKTNDYWYDTTKVKLNTPREDFCADETLDGVFKTPTFVEAEAALQASGIVIKVSGGN